MENVENKITLDVNEIQKILPHRPPFLLIDRIVNTDNETFVEAIKNVTINEPFFVGHFPGAPIMPGVLIIEAAAQAAAIVVMSNPESKDKIPFFMSIDKVKFRKPVVPGDQLKFRIDVLRLRATSGKASAVVKVNDDIVAEAILGFVIAPAPENK